MTQTRSGSTGILWARFRFSVVGSLLSSPPARGTLHAAIRALAEKTWSHPVTGRDVRVAAGTIARWYYTALRQGGDDPLGVLRRAVRKDCGKISLAAPLAERLHLQYRDYPHWSCQLHYDNLAALVKADPTLGQLRSYSTVKRYMRAHGLVRMPRLQLHQRPGEVRAERRRQTREVRSYEATHVGALWHLDFHHGSLRVLTPGGQWQRPIALAILDDHSRLCCHIQWYLSETAEDLVHGLSQAIQKRGLPRALLTDNGAAMVAEEVAEGLLRLGIVHERTLPYSPYQNGKQEVFWGTLEGRLTTLRDVTVGVIERPQSKSPDFYREMGDIFAVKLKPHNRWGGFKALRERWKTHVASSRIRPVLLIDEAQEMSPDVLSELRILSSADFDATSLLTVVLSGDGRLLELLRHEDLVPLGTRIRARLVTEAATREDLLELVGHALEKAGNASLMTTQLMETLVDHSAGNYRVLMIMGGELLAYGMAHEVAQLDEKCYLEVYQPRTPRPALKKKAKV